MLVDPHYLSTKTNCPHCSADLLPASHVHLAPIVQPLPINSRPFNFDEDDEPTRRVKRHRIEGSFGTGFGFGFGSALGEMLAGALAAIVALVLLAFWVFSWK
jgi:hypothetical protein